MDCAIACCKPRETHRAILGFFGFVFFPFKQILKSKYFTLNFLQAVTEYLVLYPISVINSSCLNYGFLLITALVLAQVLGLKAKPEQ